MTQISENTYAALHISICASLSELRDYTAVDIWILARQHIN